MRVFVTGASGVMGRKLLPQLVRAGHDVAGMTRSSARGEAIRRLGAEPVVCDVFDRDRLMEAVVATRPHVVIHQMTSIPPRMNPRRIAKEMVATNRLRTEGTRLLSEAAAEAGADKLIAQSIAFAYPPGASPSTEETPLYAGAPSAFADIVAAVHTCETTTLNTADIAGIVLRYGYFYGPGTIYARDGSFAADVRRRRVPIINDGGGVFSFIHVEDAAAATVAALEGEAGIYNVVDDEPAAVRDWLPFYAGLLEAPPPSRVPRWVARFLAGSYVLYLMTEQGGASNRKAKQALGWTPRYSTWREGLRAELAG